MLFKKIHFFLFIQQLSDLCIKSPMLFDSPPTQYATICFYFEISTAKHFEYDDIHIKYDISLPDACDIIDDNGQRKGSTHSSRRNRCNGRWLIGYCHELTISCKLDYLFTGITNNCFSLNFWLLISFDNMLVLTFFA